MTGRLCPHGFTTDECLICPTVGGSRPGRSDGGRPARREDGGNAARAGGSRLRLGGVGLLATLVVLALVGWWVVAIVAVALHLIELVAVAVVAGWVGWRLGVVHGRRAGRT